MNQFLASLGKLVGIQPSDTEAARKCHLLERFKNGGMDPRHFEHHWKRYQSLVTDVSDYLTSAYDRDTYDRRAREHAASAALDIIFNRTTGLLKASQAAWKMSELQVAIEVMAEIYTLCADMPGMQTRVVATANTRLAGYKEELLGFKRRIGLLPARQCVSALARN
jgi:hypothetical protein